MTNLVIRVILVIMVIAALVAVCYVIVNAMGILIPPWFMTILWILAALAVGVGAVKLIQIIWQSPPTA